jgi:hypothetical protein
MRKTLFILAASLTFSASSFAALPPLYQSSNEIKSVLNDPDFGKKLHSGELIESIQKNDKGYLITTNYHTIQANIVYNQTGRIGPIQYEVHFEDAQPLK